MLEGTTDLNSRDRPRAYRTRTTNEIDRGRPGTIQRSDQDVRLEVRERANAKCEPSTAKIEQKARGSPRMGRGRFCGDQTGRGWPARAIAQGCRWPAT